MRRFVQSVQRVGLALVLWALVGCPLSAAETPSSASLPQGTLSGIVVDAEDHPIADAKLVMLGYDPAFKPITLAEARSDADGRYRFGPMAPVCRNLRDIQITAEGFAPNYVPGNTYSIFPGVDCTLEPIRLQRGRVFTGQVVDDDGTPRVDAPVECTIYRYEMGHTVGEIAPPVIVRTDQNGYYRTPAFGLGRLSVSALVPERQLAYLNVFVQPGGEEKLEPLRLVKDVPIAGRVHDQRGNPIVAAEINAGGITATTDEQGQFMLRGFAAHPTFQLQISKPGYVFINWGVKVTEAGIEYEWVGDDTHARQTLKSLDVGMEESAWIEGRAVDAETGKPVRLEKVILCTFERKPNGEILTAGCRVSKFEQPEAGHFRVEYSRPDEYHLSLLAQGYHDAEAFTPLVKQLQPIDGLVVRMKRRDDASLSGISTRTIRGTVTHDGLPVKSGWVGLWGVRSASDSVNAYIRHGRTTTGDPVIYERAPILDGAYEISVPFQGIWYVVAEQPGHTLTQAGPIVIKVNEQRTLDIAWKKPGSARGRATVPAGYEGQLWVVAFNKTGLLFETPVDRQGHFEFAELPPGRFGFKLGHASYVDTEVPRAPLQDLPASAWKTLNDPWKRATVVEIRSGQANNDIALQLPD